MCQRNDNKLFFELGVKMSYHQLKHLKMCVIIRSKRSRCMNEISTTLLAQLLVGLIFLINSNSGRESCFTIIIIIDK